MHSVIISGGGTGGHIFPAVAIADEIKKRYPNCEVNFVGALGRMEMEKVPAAGYPITGLPISGLQRKKIWKNWNLPFKILKSLRLSSKLIKKYKPQLVIGVGGYASAAITKKAQNKGVPTMLQEQNGFAGMTNKLMGKKAKAVCVAYENMEQFFAKEIIHITGNPIREKILGIAETQNEWYAKYNLEQGKPIVLFIGGSLGARSINKAVEKHVQALLDLGYQIIWQTGKNYQPKVESAKGLSIHTFITEMNEVYSLADIIISRAGALSISELCFVGKPTILVPSPNVAEDHQTKNALALVDKNAAVLIADNEVENAIKERIEEVLEDEDLQNKLALNIKAMAKPRAVQDIVNIAEQVIKNG